MEQTLSIIKPDGVKRNLIGKIVTLFENEQLSVVAMCMKQLTKREAESFYLEHKERAFYSELVDYMTSGAVVIMTLEGDNAVARNRQIMGATNPSEAAEGTVRKLYGSSVGENTVHGSDSLDSAKRD